MKIKEIVYPFFFECCQFCINDYWIHIFENLAYGIPPENCKIIKGKNCDLFSYKNISIPIKRDEPEAIYDQFMDIFVNELNLDEKQEDNLIIQYKKWIDIRKKNLKTILLENYVLRFQNTHKISIEEVRKLFYQINMAISFKIINNKDIHLANNEISNITGVEIDEKTNKPHVPVYYCDCPVSFDNCEEKKKYLSEIWRKMINE
jgi:hypothetical protein